MKENENGFGFIAMIISLALVGLILFFVYNQYLSSDDQSLLESSEQIINDAQDTVDQAGEIKEKAEEAIELTN